MRKATVKDFTREVRRSITRFLAILLIVCLGVAFFVGVKSTATDMKYTADNYYDKFNIQDIRVLSTLGITEGDLDAIRSLEVIKNVEGSYFTDVVSKLKGTIEVVYRVHSLGDLDDPETINRYEVVEGRLPEKPGECVVGRYNNLVATPEIGEVITVASGNANAELSDSLNRDKFTVVGKVITPYYISYTKGTSDIGTGQLDFFMVVPKEDFAYDVYIEALVTLKSALEMDSFGHDYQELITEATDLLDNLGTDRCAIRLDEIKGQAYAELTQWQDTYNEKAAEADARISDAQKQLDATREQLSAGQAELDASTAFYDSMIQEKEQEIADGEIALEEAKEQLAQAEAQYYGMKSQVSGVTSKANELSGIVGSYDANLDSQRRALEAALNNPALDPSSASILNQMLSFMYQAEDYNKEMSDTLDELMGEVDSLMASVEQTLNEAQQSVIESEIKLEEGKAQLEQAKLDKATETARYEAELTEGRSQFAAAEALFKSESADAQKQLQDARDELTKAEAEIERIAEPEWYILDRGTIYGMANYEVTASQIDDIAKIFPVFFYLVAALVCFTTMTRMVDEQRTSIGTYKALGYSGKTIAAKYVMYAASASLAGGVIGAVAGALTYPQVFYRSYAMMYDLPPFLIKAQVPLMIISVVIGLAVTTFAAYWVCRRELINEPAALMRPKAPKAGKPIFLEHFPKLWTRLSFSAKVTLRNIVRYKSRFFMTVIGITGCCALLIAGFGISDSIGKVVPKQFQEIFSYDVSVKFSSGLDAEQMDEMLAIVEGDEHMESYIMTSSTFGSVIIGNEENDVTITVPYSDNDEFNKYIKLRNRSNKERIDLPDDGIVISEKLARDNGLKVGDSVRMQNVDGVRKNVKIAGITENYVYHYVYMSYDYYKSVFRYEPERNSILVVMTDGTSTDQHDEFGRKLIATGNVSSTLFMGSAASNFGDIVETLDKIVYVIVAAAGGLAFIVLYNLTNINIVERIREIATIKVLGFRNDEVRKYVFRENILLTVIGAVVGLFVGVILHRFIMVSLEQASYMYGYTIDFTSFVLSFAITVVFGWLVNLAMRRRLKTIPMVESLKSIE